MQFPKTIYELKKQARQTLGRNPRNWWVMGLIPTLVLMFLLYFIMQMATNLLNQMPANLNYEQLYTWIQKSLANSPQIFWYSLEGQLAYALVSIGVSFCLLDELRGRVKPQQAQISASLQVFSRPYFLRVIVLWLSYYLVFELGLQLFWLFGLYFSYGLRLTYLILMDLTQSQKVTWKQTFKTLWYSWKMMHGHKFRLFMLDLSFLGWDLLNLLTLGLTNLYVAPYKAACYAAFYQDILNLQMKARYQK
ncbi:DUF975 family protein [Bombilactobacillus folatiphilus]|uniref:DUF975 family protein n=1 Tax=Bombilactobacillus folatiphilus TaxID=2923362 RepID=A0ABY4P8Q4_9LACO|nr:DUF975 family protein [Bombilactobacillus folatiphilus]UQS81921.1 DUF975 family protein [Bombilactobacillus folatiphilus]